MSETPSFSGQQLLDRLLYRDGLMLIVDKPPGLPVHPGPKGGPSLEDYFDALRFGLPAPPHLAHRLDRDTSGCLVLGRHRKALQKLGKLFEGGLIKKTYWAIADGRLPAQQGVIDIPLKKIKLPKGWTMIAAKAGDAEAQSAVTDYRVLQELDKNLTWVELSPRTGRTHQLRVHLKTLGCPILGDWLYGPNEARGEFPPLHLHARSIEVPLYPKKDPIRVTAPPPPHMTDIFEPVE